MSADDFGWRLLAEIEEENLSEIFANLSTQVASYGAKAYTGVESIDRLIAPFCAPKHDQHITSPRTNHARSPSTKTVRQKPLCVEIASSQVGDGKTQLLYYLITIALLPASLSGLYLGGRQSAVLYFNCDGDFSIARLVKVMEHYVTNCIGTQPEGFSSGTPSKADLTDMTDHALQHLHVFSPQSMTSLIRTVELLPHYVYDPSRHTSMHRRIHSIILDSATAFYWADRNDMETANVPSTIEESGHGLRTKAESGYSRLRSLLSSLGREFACPIVYTAGNIFHKTSGGPFRALATSLPKSWLSFPTVRLIIRRSEIRGLPTAISAEEAEREARDRNEAVSQGIFALTINEEYSEDWPVEVRNEIYNTGRVRIPVRIMTEGVIIGG
ncbi:hypothetical protein K461DRAFT_291989 [Myriangium duriaei CBS 260.36]|uniref:DNA recombination and repair protein Rad51-like C-terminal domain-containing protein n=1 Tax=Myriangium duriaei CBS 260.36 TaxID=1168546 RepID=A0A9P4JA59_9PEZI|nr:hypothetical protein K461DRAFT_291989 [Myriangium duriaei CBS 260.36]